MPHRSSATEPTPADAPREREANVATTTCAPSAEFFDVQQLVGNQATGRRIRGSVAGRYPGDADVDDALSCQRMAGNRAIARALSAGQPLDPATRTYMEPRFGHDFSSVRVHTDAQAAASARALDARAYTIGDEIVFDAGEFAPATHDGRHLLAHELAHVVQQQRGRNGTDGHAVHCERAADAAAHAITANARVPNLGSAPVRPARKPRREHGKVIDREEALRLLLALPSFNAAQDTSQGAMNVVSETLQGPRTEENAADRWLRLEAACSLLTPSDAAAVRRVLTQPATPGQKHMRDAFHALTDLVQSAVLKVLDARISAPPAPEPPSLAKPADSVDELLASIKRLRATYPDQDVANWVARSLREFDWQRLDVQQPVLAALAETRPRAFRAVARWLAAGEKTMREAAEVKKVQEEQQFERDLELSKRSPGLAHMAFGPAHTMHTYRDMSWQIHHPALRFQARFGTSAAAQAGHNQLLQVGIAAGTIDLLYATAIVAPALAEAAPAVAGAVARSGAALSTAGSTAVRVIGNELALAGGALRWAGSSALLFYLQNPILVNEIGLLTTELVLSVDGDVVGLLEACKDDPAQAAFIFMQVWILHANVRTPSGRNYDATLEVQPLPPGSQQGNTLKFRTLTVTTTPVAEPAPALKGPMGFQPPGAPRQTPTPTQIPPIKRQIGFRPPGTDAPVVRQPAPDVYTPSPPVTGFARPRQTPPPPVPATHPPVITDMPRAQVVQGDQPTYGRVRPSMTGQRRDEPARASATKPPPGGGGETEPEVPTQQPKTPAVSTDAAAAPARKPGIRRFPGQGEPDIAVIEVGADGSVSIVTANRNDVQAKTGAPTHIALANAPEGLGPIAEGARRYRAYLMNGAVYRVEPLSRSAQDPGAVGAIGRALQRHRMVAPNGTDINLSPAKPDEKLKAKIFPR